MRTRFASHNSHQKLAQTRTLEIFNTSLHFTQHSAQIMCKSASKSGKKKKAASIWKEFSVPLDKDKSHRRDCMPCYDDMQRSKNSNQSYQYSLVNLRILCEFKTRTNSHNSHSSFFDSQTRFALASHSHNSLCFASHRFYPWILSMQQSMTFYSCILE